MREMPKMSGKQEAAQSGLVRVIKQLRGRKIGALGILCDANGPLTAMELGRRGHDEGYFKPLSVVTRLEHLWISWGQYVCEYLLRLGCITRCRGKDFRIMYQPTAYGKKLILLYRDI